MLLFSIYEGNTKKPVFQAILLPLGHFSVGQCHILTVLWGILRLNDWVKENSKPSKISQYGARS